jgi:hypothetical protein
LGGLDGSIQLPFDLDAWLIFNLALVGDVEVLAKLIHGAINL